MIAGTAYFIDYFKRPYYQTASIDGVNRPVLFTFNADTEHTGPGSPFASLAALAAACAKAGVAKPYVVAMSFGGVSSQAEKMKALGADAVSTYAYIGPDTSPPYQGKGLPYAQNANLELGNIAAAAAASPPVDVIPTVTAGWDPRPREVRPPPWQNGQSPPGCNVSGVARCWVQDPTMAELRNHTRDVVAFALKHSGGRGSTGGVARAGLVLVSAWNEHDEGHWICPSLHAQPTQTAKLEAIQAGIEDALRPD